MLNRIPFYIVGALILAGLNSKAQVHITSVSDAYTIELKDLSAPEIEITNLDLEPDIPYIFTNNQLKLVGYATDNKGVKYFTINRDTVKMDETGFFEYGIALRSGSNTINMEIEDNTGNKKSIKYSVILEAQASRNNFSMPVVPLPLNPGKGKYYALIIGVNNYQDSRLVSLDRPVGDAQKFYDILTTKYTFEPENMYLLKNAKRADIMNAFDELNEKLTNEDNFLIFYAGHGYWDEEKSLGYWLPSDADRYKTANWLGNSTIQDYIQGISAKHTLLIADACFSGGIFKTRKAFEDAPESIEQLYELKSRKGMTSGMLKEVPDQSVFLDYLTKRLDNNNEKYFTSLELFYQLRVPVMNNSKNTPQYGTIQNTGDEGGEFIFIRK